MSREKRAPNDPSPPFKEKEKGGEGRSEIWWPMECSKLGGQWNVLMFGGQWNVPSFVANGMFQCLVANGMFQASWPMECSKLRGQWNVPLLGDQWKVKEKHLFTLPIFPQQTLLKPSIFFL